MPRRPDDPFYWQGFLQPFRPREVFVNFPQLFGRQGVVYNVATMPIESDLDLMLRVRDGDAASFETLLRRYRLPLVSYFRRMVRDQGLAEDLAQEVFLRVYRSRERYQPEARFTTWLYRIATNLALNAIRDRKDEVTEAHGDEPDASPFLERFVDPQPTIEQRLMQADRERLIRQAVEILPENQRVAVILHKYQEVDYRRIAGILRVSESAVKSLLFRAYETLRVRLEPLLREGEI
jgi:RNA polymerase sigma-70 factor (ECF subfamily)